MYLIVTRGAREARIRWARAVFLLGEFTPGRVSAASFARIGFRLARLAGWRAAPVTLVRVVQASAGCPAQWDGWDELGRYYYLRYRYGTGEVRRYRTPDWPRSSRDELITVVTTFEHGHPLDGVISLDDFAAHAGITVADGAAMTGLRDHLRDELVLRGMTQLLAGD